MGKAKAYIGTTPPTHEGKHEWECRKCAAALSEADAWWQRLDEYDKRRIYRDMSLQLRNEWEANRT